MKRLQALDKRLLISITYLLEWLESAFSALPYFTINKLICLSLS